LNNKTKELEEFWLKKRALHVYGESARVFHFEEACQQGNVAELGKLMNESHTSCRDLFECSCPELDETVEKCLKAGCIGARLTGAGWGGCVVALLDKNRKEDIEKQLNVLFWSEPSQGIEITFV